MRTRNSVEFSNQGLGDYYSGLMLLTAMGLLEESSFKLANCRTWSDLLRGVKGATRRATRLDECITYNWIDPTYY